MSRENVFGGELEVSLTSSSLSGAAVANPIRRNLLKYKVDFSLPLIFLFALSVRLALLPFATQDTSDHTLRVFIAWNWVEHPFLFLHGRWPTLHFYLVGPIIKLFDDP